MMRMLLAIILGTMLAVPAEAGPFGIFGKRKMKSVQNTGKLDFPPGTPDTPLDVARGGAYQTQPGVVCTRDGCYKVERAVTSSTSLQATTVKPPPAPPVSTPKAPVPPVEPENAQDGLKKIQSRLDALSQIAQETNARISETQAELATQKKRVAIDLEAKLKLMELEQAENLASLKAQLAELVPPSPPPATTTPAIPTPAE